MYGTSALRSRPRGGHPDHQVEATTTLTQGAVPDVTNVQLQVLTSSPGLGPIEVERLIPIPVETSLSGIPFEEGTRPALRSLGKNGRRPTRIAAVVKYVASESISRERLLQMRYSGSVTNCESSTLPRLWPRGFQD